MAQFLKLRYHEDTTPKHKITKEELDFLKDLQKEMNTQDYVEQVNPRFWTICDWDKFYAEKLYNTDGYAIYDSDNCNIICDINEKDILPTIIKNILEAFESFNYHLTKEEISTIQNINHYSNLYYTLTCICDNYGLTMLQYEKQPRCKGVFFTHKAAQNHLRNYAYHYDEEALIFADTVCKSEETPLWDILRKVDFEALESVLKERGDL